MLLLRALVFDVFGTLFDVKALAVRLEAFFPGQGEVLGHLWRAKQLEYTWLLALMDRYEDFQVVTLRALRYAARAHGLLLQPEVEAALLSAYRELPTFPQVPQVLEAFGRRVPLYVLSNGTEEMLHAPLAHAHLQGFFRGVFSAETARTYKPSPRVYALVTQGLGLTPEAVGFVSSNAWDVAGASAFGFRAFWVNRGGLPFEALEPGPTLEALDLDQLLAPLEAQALWP